MHEELIIYAGNKINAKKALIMLHGRGANAEDILSLAENLDVTEYLLAAPQASGNSWYPNSFLALPRNNEPWLSSALDLVHSVVGGFIKQGIKKEKIYFLGFSQGACLTLEYTARNAEHYGGIVAFTGGLIGDKIYKENYKGDFSNTPVFIGTSNPDFHVPVERVRESANILRNMGADITERIYPNMGHTINQDEINHVNRLIFKP
ncbi:MAG TPA: dienelactone hydrolase family protein [Puia sp.]|nr:dienelactone hydrolase family protein [Puia sp.]